MPATGATIFYHYCERGGDASFWAEPLNAVTNGGFILAALAGIVLIARLPAARRSPWHYFFVVNFIAIGVGSFLFHTMPNALTVQADTVPIGVFMIAYLTFAMRRFAELSWFLTLAAIAGFIAVLVPALDVQCWDAGLGVLKGVLPGPRGKCLNGSLGYAPALIALWLTAGWLAVRRHPAAPLIFAAGGVFVVSLTCRSFDRALCQDIVIWGRKVGTHFLWHILNSLTLFLLLLAAIRYGSVRQEVIPPRPKPRPASYAPL